MSQTSTSNLIPESHEGRLIVATGGGTTDFAGWRAGARVRTAREMQRGEVLLKVSRQFQASNLARVTRVENDRAYLTFIDPAHPHQPRQGARGEFVEWDPLSNRAEPADVLYRTIPPRDQTVEFAAACVRAEALGFQVYRGTAEDDELAGRCWWTLMQDGWGEVEVSQEDYDTMDDAWEAAILARALDSELAVVNP
jgi:hypothetical protein